MTDLRLTINAALAIVARDFKTMLSYRLRFIAQLLSVFFSLTLFFYISRLVNVAHFESPDAYYAFVVVGLVSLQILNSTLATPPTSVRTQLIAGTFERIVLSPFGAVAGVASTVIFPFLYSLTTGFFMLVFASLVFGVPVEWATAPLVIPLAVLGALSFAPFGVLLLSVVLAIKDAPGGATFIIAGITLIAGLYFPVELLPNWIEWAAYVQPFKPALDLMRSVLVGTPLEESAWLSLAKLVGFAIVLVPISVLALRAAVNTSRRKGTILEY